jgi:RNA polymerase-binding transcription factor DksA
LLFVDNFDKIKHTFYSGVSNMGRIIVPRIQESLIEKRQNIEQWLEASSVDEKETCLTCATEQDVHTHLDVIGNTMLKTELDTFGVCEVCQGGIESSVLEVDYTTAICLSCLSDDERHQLETELELSQTVQRALMPQESPAIPGMEVAAFSRPTQIVSGDYFDFIPLEDGSYGLTIADAMGHGIAASMFIASLQATLHTLLPESQSPTAVLERINRFYLHNVNYTTFVTMFLGIFNPRTRLLTYFNAGHHPPMLVRSGSHEVTWLPPNGAAIGIIEDYKIEPSQVQLGPGDVLVLYTDGITEAIDAYSKEFGHERLGELALKYADSPIGEIISMLRQELAEFTDSRPPVDDITLVVCKVTD